MLMAVPDLYTVDAGEKHPRKKPRFSRAFRATLKLQGKYMGTMRGLPPHLVHAFLNRPHATSIK